MNWVAEIHAVALTGLIAWPLAGTTVRLLGSTNKALFGCFMVGFLGQALSWQRYIEAELLLTLAVFFAARLDPRRAETAVLALWFALYAALSVAKAAFGLHAG